MLLLLLLWDHFACCHLPNKSHITTKSLFHKLNITPESYETISRAVSNTLEDNTEFLRSMSTRSLLSRSLLLDFNMPHGAYMQC